MYFAITVTEDGVDITEFKTKGELIESMQDKEGFIHQHMEAAAYETPGIFRDALPGYKDNGFWGMGNDVIIIKGDIVVPKPKKEVVNWDL